MHGVLVVVSAYVDSHTVSPLAFATGVLGAMVAIGIVAVPLLMGCTCRSVARNGKVAVQ